MWRVAILGCLVLLLATSISVVGCGSNDITINGQTYTIQEYRNEVIRTLNTDRFIKRGNLDLSEAIEQNDVVSQGGMLESQKEALRSLLPKSVSDRYLWGEAEYIIRNIKAWVTMPDDELIEDLKDAGFINS